MSGTVVLVAGSVPLEQLIGPVGPDQATRYGPNVTVVDNTGANITPASADEPVVSATVAQKTIKIQSPEHQLLLRTVPRVTMYGPDINLV
jgi:uncharacterized membrane protein